jgi:hypothetical protein
LEHLAKIWRIPLDDDAETSSLHLTAGLNRGGISLYLALCWSVFSGFTPGRQPLEGGRVGKSIHLLWFQVWIVCGYECSIMKNFLDSR